MHSKKAAPADIREEADAHDPAHGSAGGGALSGGAADGDRRRGSAAVRRLLGDLRPWQRGRPGRGALPGARDPADLPRPQRAGHGAGGGGVRQGQEPPADDGLHHLDRPGCHEHADRRGRGARQPAAGPVPAGRRVRQPPARPGAAAGRGLQRRHHGRHRLLPAGLALVGPDHPAGAAPDLAAARDPGPHRPGRVRPGHAGDVPGRPGRGVRLPRRASSSRGFAPPSAGRAPTPTSWRAWSSSCARPSGR